MAEPKRSSLYESSPPENPPSGSQGEGSFGQPGSAFGMQTPAPVFSNFYEGTVNPKVKVNERSFVGDLITEDYVPNSLFGLYGYLGLMNRNRPPFSYFTVRDMLCDPRVLLGLWLLKGPIVAKTEFEVECNNAEVTDFAMRQLDRFYRVAAHRVLKAIEWGYSASEVEYKTNSETGLIEFHDVVDMESLDCRPVLYRGKIVGFYFRRNADPWSNQDIDIKKIDKAIQSGSKFDPVQPDWVYVGAPRALWHVHWPEKNKYFGVSRLFGVHVPWWEKWAEDGYRNIRRLWFTKCAFDGGIMYHPNGTINTMTRGPLPARDYARQLIEQKRTGAVLTLPNTVGPDGQGRAWEYVAPEGSPTPAGLLEYGESLDMEILEAFGISPEVIQSIGESGGAGGPTTGGVPTDAFHAALHEINLNLVKSFNMQCLRYLIQYQFGVVEYEIKVQPIGKKEAAAAAMIDPETGMPLLPADEGNQDDPEASDDSASEPSDSE